MSLKVSDVPDADQRPIDAVSSIIRCDLLRARVTRRGVLRTGALAAMAAGVASLDLLPFGNKAYATGPPYSTWNHCQDYDAQDPEGDWKWCNPNGSSAGYIKHSYCDQGYHRNDTVGVDPPCSTNQFSVSFNRCFGDDGSSKNAWEWHISDNPSPPNPDPVRCSDGKVHFVDICAEIDTTHNSSCIHFLSS
jgi:hypothetical protein